jgi:hypothetical protein
VVFARCLFCFCEHFGRLFYHLFLETEGRSEEEGKGTAELLVERSLVRMACWFARACEMVHLVEGRGSLAEFCFGSFDVYQGVSMYIIEWCCLRLFSLPSFKMWEAHRIASSTVNS